MVRCPAGERDFRSAKLAGSMTWRPGRGRVLACHLAFAIRTRLPRSTDREYKHLINNNLLIESTFVQDDG